MTTSDTVTPLSAERLAEMLTAAFLEGASCPDGITRHEAAPVARAYAARALRTQSPAEWQVEAQEAMADAETWLAALVDSAPADAPESVHEVVKTITRLKAARQSMRAAGTPPPVESQVDAQVVGWGVRKKGDPVFQPFLNRPDAGPEYEVVPLGVIRAAGTPSVGEGEVDLSRDFFKMTPSQLRAAIEAEPDGMEADAGRLHPEATPSEAVTISPEEVTDELEQLRQFARSFHITVVDNTYKDVTLHLDQPHSLSIRLRNDSSKSWIFADLEARRKAALEPTP